MKKLFTLTLICFLLINTVAQAQQVIIGTSTALSVFSPINRTNDYSVYEIIYLASEINTPGMISKFAFQRADGTETSPIENVSIYMQNTSLSTLTAGSYSDAGYTLVYSGNFPNDAGAGWREVNLDTPFNYDGTSNLAVLTVKGYQAAVANTPVTPRWYYTLSSGGNRARRYYGANPITSTTNLSTTNFNANARLDFGTVGIREINPEAAMVFPNPSTGNVNFRINAFSDSFVSIYNSSGQKIRFIRGESNKDILVQHLDAGIYFYSIGTANGSEIDKGKFIVQ